MAKEPCSEGNAFDLLKQLEHILESDSLIDEVGFVHPSQFMALSGGSNASFQPPVNATNLRDEVVATDTSECVIDYDCTIFWNNDHKLAISMEALLPLYKAAMHAFMDVVSRYKMLIKLSESKNSPVNETVENKFLDSIELENELMRHSKALLILSCEFGTAWNSRKLVVSRKLSFSLLVEELQLSALVLSYSPKSEHAWSHRRWAIKMVSGKYQNLPELLGKESELVMKIAEKSRMNYRAWQHCSWLVSYMTRSQVVDELKQTRKWAELHVADNCCFHYRRRLMLQLVEGNRWKDDQSLFDLNSDLFSLWKEELSWDEWLIKCYVGREALWVHRRFLSKCWINHFMDNQSTFCEHSEGYNLDTFVNHELQLIRSCLVVSDDEFEDAKLHSELAASYILWMSKQIPQLRGSEFHAKSEELGDLKSILYHLSPEKASLWEALIS